MLLLTLALFVSLALALLAGGFVYQQYGLLQDRRKCLPSGRLVQIRDRHLHISETGNGQPTVIFESGLASSCLSWTPVQEIVSQETRAISYDRAGIGWSDEPPHPRAVSSVIDDLGALLRVSGTSPPYILVGHSFGALIARAYASLRSEEIAGLVLIDPVSLDVWADCSPENNRRLRLGAKLSRRGVLLADLGVIRLALAALASGRTRLPRAVAKASAGRAMGTMGRLIGVVQKLPPSLRTSVRSHWSQAKSFRAMAEYLEILPDCARQARAMVLSPSIPLTVLSASTATRQEIDEREQWVNRSERGRHIQIRDSGHWIQLEHPTQVAEAVVDLVDYVRQRSAATGKTLR